ncbi:MAG TPA: histidine kinase dimerization/phospho-acceptor domain-containing protein [Candidatus Acidoferrum sp.]|jgi:signal transduction histidine kinase
MIASQEKTILLVSDDAGLYAAARREFEAREEGLRIATVSSMAAARQAVSHAAPAVILLEFSSAACEVSEDAMPPVRLELMASSLAMYAPVVVIGHSEQKSGLANLISAGVADFVVRAENCVPLALEMVEQRLRRAEQSAGATPAALPRAETNGEPAFGEILRHELNNPLTGILGNAELLLAEVRRKNDGCLPQGGQQRLETIAALAVRLRETVRRLSQDWEAQHCPVDKTA